MTGRVSSHPLSGEEFTQDIYAEVQRVAEQRLADAEAVYDAEEAGEEPPDVELAGPYDGCPTCIVREVLDAARPYFAALVAFQDFVHSAREGQDMQRPTR